MSRQNRRIWIVINYLVIVFFLSSILVLLIVHGFALAGNGPIDVVVAASLLYFAHTLPAAIVGWKDPYSKMWFYPAQEANKQKYNGPLLQKVIEECATVQVPTVASILRIFI